MSSASSISSTSSATVAPQEAMAGSDASSRDQRLIESARGGDVNAFDELVGLHQNRIFNLCYWLLGSREDAADATQEAFVRAYRSLHTFRGDSAFGTWLHRISVNASLDLMQRRKRAPLPYTDLETGEDAGDADELASRLANQAREGNTGAQSPLNDDPALISAQHERRRLVREALAALPEHYRLALVLFDIEGHSYEEIAQTLRLPMGTVKSRINRARLALRDRLQGERELFEV